MNSAENRLAKLAENKAALKSEIQATKLKIKTLAPFYSTHQVRAWKEYHKLLSRRLSSVERDAKEITQRMNAGANLARNAGPTRNQL
jgi:hypothetical protein